jgi:hypothetical protein
MKYYDAQLIKNYIEENKESVVSVTCGMREDWGWTAEEVYSDNDGYLQALSEKTVGIAGIKGSTWATPVMEIETKDGKTMIENCYFDDGESTDSNLVRQQKIFAGITGGMDYKE